MFGKNNNDPVNECACLMMTYKYISDAVGEFHETPGSIKPIFVERAFLCMIYFPLQKNGSEELQVIDYPNRMSFANRVPHSNGCNTSRLVHDFQNSWSRLWIPISRDIYSAAQCVLTYWRNRDMYKIYPHQSGVVCSQKRNENYDKCELQPNRYCPKVVIPKFSMILNRKVWYTCCNLVTCD